MALGSGREFVPVRGTPDSATAAANTAVVITYAAVTGLRHAIEQIDYSYSATPTGGSLKIEDGSGNTIFQQDITAAGPGQWKPPRAFAGSVNTALIITLAAGSGAVVGKLNISKYGEVRTGN